MLSAKRYVPGRDGLALFHKTLVYSVTFPVTIREVSCVAMTDLTDKLTLKEIKNCFFISHFFQNPKSRKIEPATAKEE